VELETLNGSLAVTGERGLRWWSRRCGLWPREGCE